MPSFCWNGAATKICFLAIALPPEHFARKGRKSKVKLIITSHVKWAVVFMLLGALSEPASLLLTAYSSPDYRLLKEPLRFKFSAIGSIRILALGLVEDDLPLDTQHHTLLVHICRI